MKNTQGKISMVPNSLNLKYLFIRQKRNKAKDARHLEFLESKKQNQNQMTGLNRVFLSQRILTI